MGLINLIEIFAFKKALNNMSEDKIVDMIEDFQRREFGREADKAISITADKLISIGLTLYKRRRLNEHKRMAEQNS